MVKIINNFRAWITQANRARKVLRFWKFDIEQYERSLYKPLHNKRVMIVQSEYGGHNEDYMNLYKFILSNKIGVKSVSIVKLDTHSNMQETQNTIL